MQESMHAYRVSKKLQLLSDTHIYLHTNRLHSKVVSTQELVQRNKQTGAHTTRYPVCILHCTKAPQPLAKTGARQKVNITCINIHLP